jgi:hypothetical protein
MEVIARDGNISVDKVERFSGPILQERVFIIDQVHGLTPRRDGKETAKDAPTFLDIVISKLAPRGVDVDAIDWNTWRLEDGSWTIELHYPNRIEPGLVYAEPSHPSRIEERTEPREPIRIDSAPVRSISSILDDLPDNDPTDEEFEAEVSRETPRLVSIRETPAPGDSQDGITSRAKVPSWDEIMFGRKTTEEPTPEN